MTDWEFDPLLTGRRFGYLPLWFGLNAVVALMIGFVLGWGLRPLAAPPASAPGRAVGQGLPPAKAGPGGAPVEARRGMEQAFRPAGQGGPGPLGGPGPQPPVPVVQ